MERGENRTALLERGHVFCLVIGGFVLPAPEQDAEPLEGQRADDGVVFFALGRVVLDIVARPLAAGHREPGKLVKGLADKLRASPPAVNGLAAAAALGYRGDPRAALRGGRRPET